MKKIFIFNLLFWGLAFQTLQAQCDTVNVPVFNTLFPSDTSDHNNYFICDGIQASNGEYVGIGVKANVAGTYDGFIFRLDTDGDLIAPPIYLEISSNVLGRVYVWPFDDDYKSLAQITEIFDANGVSQGYFLSMTTLSFVNTFGIALIRIDHTGVLQVANFLDSEKSDMRSVDCLRRSDNGNMVVLAPFYSTSSGDLIYSNCLIEANPITCAVLGQHFSKAGVQTSQLPYKIEPINVDVARFVVTSRVDSANIEQVGLALYDGSYNRINHFGKGRFNMKTNSSNETPYPTGLAVVNNKAYVSGYYDLNDGSGKAEAFIFEASFAPPVPTPVLGWSKIVPATGLGNLGLSLIDMTRSIDDQLLIIGNSNGFSGGIQINSLLKLTTAGTFLWARQSGFAIGGASYAQQRPGFIAATNDGGSWFGAGLVSQVDASFKAYAMKTDPSGWLHDCNCLNNYTPIFQTITPQTTPLFLYSIPDGELPSIPDIAQTETPINQVFCNQFSPQQDTCSANFTWQPTGNCYEVNLQASGTGVPPLSYQWSFGATSQSTFFPLPCPGNPVLVCLTVTDATGCSAEYCELVQAPPDMVQPIINCAAGGTVNMSPGLCGANLNLAATAIDNCIGTLSIQYFLPGGIPLSNPNTFYPPGQTTLIAVATDCSGNTNTCTTTINVLDNKAPNIICPPGKSVNTQICFGGANVDFNPPLVTDNCPGVTFTCSHTSGDFFPCTTTFVTCTATDASGNTQSCNFPITVNCSCGSIAGAFMECTEDPYIYQFTIQVQDQSDASSCNLSLNGPSGMSNVVINPFIAGVAEITGELTVTDPIPANFSFSVTMNCVCPSGLPITCDIPLQISTVCCKKIAIEDQVVCADAATFDVDIVTPTTGTLNNIGRVKWYIQYKPANGVCPSAPWGGIPYQDAISNTLTTLHLYPEYLTGDICYYAVVSLNDGPCTEITSNIACVNLCEPTVCTIPDQQFCYTGAPIVPDLMTLTFVPNDSACIQSWFWVDPNDQSVQTGGDHYQPTQLLSSSNPTVDCFEDFVYTVVLNDECGQHFCTSTVRLWNDAAPKGTLVIDPFESPQPFCPGEDLTLAFEPDCIQPSEEWTWLISLDGLNYSPLAGAGTSNPLWHTNQLYQDTWYAVETTNGMCDPHQVGLFIDIQPELQLVSFDAVYDNPCFPDGVLMTVEFTPGSSADCAYTIEWYKDGVSVSSTTFAGTLETYTYVPPVGEGVAGNYYCTIKDCCDNIIKSNVVKIEPPCFAVVAGPCFICNQETTTLTGLIVNMPVGSSCTYEWTALEGGHINGSTTGDQIQVSTNGIYVFSADCIDINGNLCNKTAQFDLLECFNDSVNCGNVSTMEFYAMLNISFLLQPNPTGGLLNLEFETFTTESYQVHILDAQGRVLIQKPVSSGVKTVQFDLNQLPSGAYFLRLTDAHGRSGARLFIRE